MNLSIQTAAVARFFIFPRLPARVGLLVIEPKETATNMLQVIATNFEGKTMKTGRKMNFESMEKKELFAADLGVDLMAADASPSAGTAEIEFVEVGGSHDAASPVCYLRYKLDRAFIKSWSTSGDADDRPSEENASLRVSQEYFTDDSFTFAVEREMKESGEKGGTADINIGVGELQECTVSKSMDTASSMLAQYAINGNSPAAVDASFA